MIMKGNVKGVLGYPIKLWDGFLADDTRYMYFRTRNGSSAKCFRCCVQTDVGHDTTLESRDSEV